MFIKILTNIVMFFIDYTLAENHIQAIDFCQIGETRIYRVFLCKND